jgi:hypothetical protein
MGFVKRESDLRGIRFFFPFSNTGDNFHLILSVTLFWDFLTVLIFDML